MATRRFGRAQQAMALVPLAVLSAAWTISVAGAGGETAVADQTLEGTLPDGSRVPARAIRVPASVSDVDSLGTGARAATAGDIARTGATPRNSPTSGIPAAALAAYQRAEAVINAADTSCDLTWQLVAAIGRVESDHGRSGGNTLDRDGLARPGIYGLPLDGTRGTTRIADTDAGQYDDDLSFDRAVGPMQFIPSTWSVVGVDADGDGTRNPQDVDDAALATAVYLCSGDDDLGTSAGQRTAVFRYNHSEAYVDLVLSIMDAYLDGDYTSVPNGITTADYIVPDPAAQQGGGRGDGTGSGKGPGGRDDPGPGTSQPAAAPTDQASTAPAQPTAPSASPGGGSGSGSGGGSGGGSGDDSGGASTPKPPKVTLPPLPSTSVEPVDDVLTRAQAIVQCTLDGYVDNPLRTDDPFDRCVEAYTNG